MSQTLLLMEDERSILTAIQVSMIFFLKMSLRTINQEIETGKSLQNAKRKTHIIKKRNCVYEVLSIELFKDIF